MKKEKAADYGREHAFKAVQAWRAQLPSVLMPFARLWKNAVNQVLVKG
ncbi:MAG: hypothetical protein GX771_09045 [Halomonadaceae bacterium]|nr:hypothetical protein [Halomonadaceae bacterium]